MAKRIRPWYDPVPIIMGPERVPKWRLHRVLCKNRLYGVYFLLRRDGLCKIGHSECVTKRTWQHQDAHKRTLFVWHTIAVEDGRQAHAETWFHTVFASRRRDGEWFDLPPLVLKWIRSLDSWPAESALAETTKTSAVKRHASEFGLQLRNGMSR